jgi:hypothetical protein
MRTVIELSPKLLMLIFVILVGVVVLFLLDFVGIHLPYMVRYAVLFIAVIVYALTLGLRTGRKRKVSQT